MGLNETGRLNEREHCKMVLNVRMHGSPMQSRLTVVESVSYNITQMESHMLGLKLNTRKVNTPLLKKVIKLNLPIQVCFFVYQYAKLRMFQFYYDFFDKYLDHEDFQMCEMDTDSAYIAISGESVVFSQTRTKS